MLEHQKILADLHLARSFDKKIDFTLGSNGIHFLKIAEMREFVPGLTSGFFENRENPRISIKYQ